MRCPVHAVCGGCPLLGVDGLAIEGVSLFDMFPQTRHVEVVVWLSRR